MRIVETKLVRGTTDRWDAVCKFSAGVHIGVKTHSSELVSFA